MRDLIATYESNVAVKALMFLFFSKWAAGFGCVYHLVLAVMAFQSGGMAMAMPSVGFIAFNSLLLVRVLLGSRQTFVQCPA